MTEKALTVRPPAQLSMAETMSLAEAFARSGFFKDASDSSKAVVKILAGRELGIPPVAAMTSIYIVEGKVSLSANLLASLVKRHPLYDYHVDEQTAERCEITFYEDGAELGQSIFTMEDAKLAGVSGKFNWTHYPRNMLFARAMSNGVKWFCPDVTSGAPVYTPDEMGQAENEDGTLSLFATPEQLDAIRARMRGLYPDVEFKQDGHYNYILKRNGYKALHELSAEDADALLATFGEDAPTEDESDLQPGYDTEPTGDPFLNGTDVGHAADLAEAKREIEGIEPEPTKAKPVQPPADHWTTSQDWRKFYAYADKLGLDNDAVHAALQVDSAKAYTGTKEQALMDLKAHAMNHVTNWTQLPELLNEWFKWLSVNHIAPNDAKVAVVGTGNELVDYDGTMADAMKAAAKG